MMNMKMIEVSGVLAFGIFFGAFLCLFVLGFFDKKEKIYVANQDILPNTNIKGKEGRFYVAQKIAVSDKPQNAFTDGSPALEVNLKSKEFIEKGTILTFDMFDYIETGSDE